MEKHRVINKAILFLLLGHLYFSAYSQGDSLSLLRKQWIAINCRHAIDSVNIFSIEGSILALYDSFGESYFPWSDSLVQFDYRVKDRLIIYNDTSIYGVIHHLSNDSLVLLVDNNSMLTVYLPTIGTHCNISKQTFDSTLIRKPWILPYYWYGDVKFDFLDVESGYSSQIKYCTSHFVDDYNFYQSGAYWSTFEYGGNVFLIISDHNLVLDINIFQLTSFDTSNIETIRFTKEGQNPITFKAVELLSDREYKELINIITSKEWQIQEIQETYKYYGLKSRWSDAEIIPITRHRKEGFLKNDFLSKELNYKFSTDSTYSISSDNLKYSEGTWIVTKDGEYLILIQDQSRNSYLKLLEYNKNQIVFRQIVELKESQKSDKIMKYDYIIKLY